MCSLTRGQVFFACKAWVSTDWGNSREGLGGLLRGLWRASQTTAGTWRLPLRVVSRTGVSLHPVCAQVLSSLDAEGLGVAVVRNAGIMLGARHGIERLVNCWHGGALELGAVRQAIRDAIAEYGTSNDVAEVARCLRDLDAAAYNHEAVVAAGACARERGRKGWHARGQEQRTTPWRLLLEAGAVLFH